MPQGRVGSETREPQAWQGPILELSRNQSLLSERIGTIHGEVQAVSERVGACEGRMEGFAQSLAIFERNLQEEHERVGAMEGVVERGEGTSIVLREQVSALTGDVSKVMSKVAVLSATPPQSTPEPPCHESAPPLSSGTQNGSPVEGNDGVPTRCSEGETAPRPLGSGNAWAAPQGVHAPVTLSSSLDPNCSSSFQAPGNVFQPDSLGLAPPI